MIKRILVGLGDVAYSKVATQYAISMARQHGGMLTGVTLFDVDRLDRTGPVPVGGVEFAKELREHRMKVTREVIGQTTAEFEEACKAASVPYRILHEKGDPFEAMVSCSRYHDLMICGLKNLFEHGVIQEPPAELIRLVKEGVRPLLAVTDQYRPINRVLIAYSGSAESAKTMKRFAQLNLLPDVTVRIVTFEHSKDHADELLFDAADYLRAHGFEPETAFVPNNPAKHLLPYADDWNADLIVLGNSARNLLMRRIFGATALHVIQHTDRPLFLCQ